MRANQLTLLGVMLLIASPLLAQNPWNRVPPLPSSCYQKDDSFGEDAARVELEFSAAVERQKVVNEEVAQRWTNLDPAQQQVRLTAFMQRNPAGAADAVQQLQSGFGVQVTSYPSGKQPDDFRTELQQLEADYLADGNRLLPNVDPETAGAAAYARYNAAYVALCHSWIALGARTGSDPRFSGFLARYREFLTREYIPL